MTSSPDVLIINDYRGAADTGEYQLATQPALTWCSMMVSAGRR